MRLLSSYCMRGVLPPQLLSHTNTQALLPPGPCRKCAGDTPTALCYSRWHPLCSGTGSHLSTSTFPGVWSLFRPSHGYKPLLLVMLRAGRSCDPAQEVWALSKRDKTIQGKEKASPAKRGCSPARGPRLLAFSLIHSFLPGGYHTTWPQIL